jgi:hypothetical protein
MCFDKGRARRAAGDDFVDSHMHVFNILRHERRDILTALQVLLGWTSGVGWLVTGLNCTGGSSSAKGFPRM